MGALAPVSSWTPEDDLLLKNAVEAGASLESLAKGAVQFSRRFIIRELQERWLSLLYDPEISCEASERMMDFERSTSNLMSKSSKVESLKDGKGTLKRKVESVRRRYNAMKKRICNDPLSQVDLSFFIAPAENVFHNGNEAAGHNDILGDPMDSHFDLENNDFDDLHHVFPQDMRNNIDGVSHESDNGDGGNRENQLNEQNNICGQIPQAIEHNMSLGGNCSADGGISSSKELPMHNILADNMEMNCTSNNDGNNMYPCLEETHVFNSQIADCDASFQHLQYPSPPPEMPDWRNMEDMSAMEMTGDSKFRGENLQIGDAFGLPDDATNMPSDFDIVHSDTEFQNHITCDGMKTSASCPQFDLHALTDTLLMDDDDMLLMDDDGREIDKYGLSSLLLDSPADMNDDQMLNVVEMDAPVAPETDLHMPISESTVLMDQGGNELDTSKEQNLPSTSDIQPQPPDFFHTPICCTLNSEDLEVPNNDHVIFPSKPCAASTSRRGLNEVSHSALPIKNFSHKQVNETGRSLLLREMKKFGELHSDSQTRVRGPGFNHAVGDSNAKLEPPRSENIGVSSRPPAVNCSTLVSKAVISETVSRKQSCSDLSDLPVKASNGLHSHFESGGVGIKQEGQVAAAVKKLEVHTEIGTTNEMAPEPVEEPLLSDSEEQFSDDDSNIPCCSDVESMILDSDLGPEDLDEYSSREVAMYQSEDAKREIIRLEQGAHACTHRAIASHGAFAVLYGRISKHYIKKLEVLLGRATDDSIVDIDLGKEGRANKISRRQAIIKMDENGEFGLKNLGKSAILVDNKEVLQGQSVILHSNCLIEVREISFIFEKYQARVKQYWDGVLRL